MSKRYHEDHGNDDSPAPGAAQAGSGDVGGRVGGLPQRSDGSRPARLHRSPSHSVVRAVVRSVCWQPLASVTRAWLSRVGSEPSEACPGARGTADDVQASEESSGPLPLRSQGSARQALQVQALPWARLRFSIGRWRVCLRRLTRALHLMHAGFVARVYSRPVALASDAWGAPFWLRLALCSLPHPGLSGRWQGYLAQDLWTTVQPTVVDNRLYIGAVSLVRKLRRHLWR